MPARAVLPHVALGLLDERLLPQRVRELLPRRANHVIAEIDLCKSATGRDVSHGFIQRKSKRQATKLAKAEPESAQGHSSPRQYPNLNVPVVHLYGGDGLLGLLLVRNPLAHRRDRHLHRGLRVPLPPLLLGVE